jgi:drug/metabolite transporter (DMT)-like permease
LVNTLLIAGLCLVWGATWVVIKIGLSESPPFYGAAFRFLLASAVLAVLVGWSRRRMPTGKKLWGWMIFAGILMYFGSYAVVYYVEQYINGGLAAILFASFPFFVAIGAHIHLPGERLTAFRIAGLIVGFVGVVIVTGGGLSGPGTTRWWAPVIMLLSPFCSAVASIIIKRHLTKDDPFSINFVQMAIGTVVLFAMALSVEDIATFQWTAVSIGAVVFLALFGSVFTFVTYYHLLRTMEATKLALIAFVTPIVASVLDWLMLGATLSLTVIGGAVLVLIGIWLVNVVGERNKSEAAA